MIKKMRKRKFTPFVMGSLFFFVFFIFATPPAGRGDGIPGPIVQVQKGKELCKSHS